MRRWWCQGEMYVRMRALASLLLLLLLVAITMMMQGWKASFHGHFHAILLR